MSENISTEEPEATDLVSINGVIQRMGGPEAFDQQYSWTQETIADMLLDLQEKVFKFRGTYLIDEDVAGMLESFLKDFLN